MNWLFNVSNANNRTHLLAFLFVIVGAIQAIPGLTTWEASHKVWGAILFVVFTVYATYNHPTGTNGPTMKGV